MPIIHWFRRDLRLHDNMALFNAHRDSADGIITVFIFDEAILRHPDCGGAILQFMLGCLADLRKSLRSIGGDLVLLHENPLDALKKLAKKSAARAVYYNKDYDPLAIDRDMEVERVLLGDGIEVRPFKDLVIFEEREILAASTGEPYTVYTPYRKAWMKKLGEKGVAKIVEKPRLRFAKVGKVGIEVPTVESLGFEPIDQMDIAPGETAARKMLNRFAKRGLAKYARTRNFPAITNGTSRLSPHLRHGTISIREAVAVARKSEAWLGELIWREFYQQILFNFPEVATDPFRENLRNLKWREDESAFNAWCTGHTGLPIVDAGMRQLNATGWMHNRVRMIVAMFLTKDLRIDYRRGERYFANHLIDHEVAQNNGNWQWSAGTGTDAQPWFRIFNPASQSKTYDAKGEYIRRWIPELKRIPTRYIHEPHTMPIEIQLKSRCIIGKDYPAPIVDHALARAEALKMFRRAK
jgi:deoxyribodipyrimidine photo-lyase